MDEVFCTVKEYHRLNDPPAPHVNVQHPSLKPYLRSYQKQAILWMLTKEKYGVSIEKNVPGLNILCTFISTT